MLSPELWADEIKSMPEHAPNVSFDVSLNETVKSIDFDYMEYQFHALHTLGIPPKYVNKLDIFITDKELGGSSEVGGRFYWNDEGPESYEKFQIEIKLPQLKDKRRVSVLVTDYLIHETQHFADYINNVYPNRTSKLGSFSTRIAYKLTPWERAAFRATEDFRENPRNDGLNLIRIF